MRSMVLPAREGQIGMLLERDRSARIIAISQEAFTDSIPRSLQPPHEVPAPRAVPVGPLSTGLEEGSRGLPSRVRHARTHRYDLLRT